MASFARGTARIEFRLPAKLKKEIERAAAVENLSLTEFATAVLSEVVREVLAEQSRHEHVRLSNRGRDRFLAMLDAPPAPNRAILAAAKKHRQRVA
jgi:uncharacterized protein (DUF1778 family)